MGGVSAWPRLLLPSGGGEGAGPGLPLGLGLAPRPLHPAAIGGGRPHARAGQRGVGRAGWRGREQHPLPHGRGDVAHPGTPRCGVRGSAQPGGAGGTLPWCPKPPGAPCGRAANTQCPDTFPRPCGNGAWQVERLQAVAPGSLWLSEPQITRAWAGPRRCSSASRQPPDQPCQRPLAPGSPLLTPHACPRLPGRAGPDPTGTEGLGAAAVSPGCCRPRRARPWVPRAPRTLEAHPEPGALPGTRRAVPSWAEQRGAIFRGVKVSVINSSSSRRR